MIVMVPESCRKMNKYVDHLVRAYKTAGVQVVTGSENFYDSNLHPDLLHIQWPETLYRWDHPQPETEETLHRIEERLRFFRSGGTRIVQTVHNLEPHVNPSTFDRKVFATLARSVDLFIHHGEHSIALYKEHYPESQSSAHRVAPHGAFQVGESDLTAEESRAHYRLQTDRYTFLNFGRQRSQKGASFTKTLFREWNHPQSQLFTIGPLSEEFPERPRLLSYVKKIHYRYIRPPLDDGLTRVRKRERTLDRVIDEEEVPRVLAATDVLFLGHLHGLNSGLLVMGASSGKGVIYPDIVNFTEQLREYPLAESYTAGDHVSAREALDRMMTRIESMTPGYIKAENGEWLRIHDWNEYVAVILRWLEGGTV